MRPLVVFLLGAAVFLVFLAFTKMMYGPRDYFADIGAVSTTSAAIAPSGPPVAPLGTQTPLTKSEGPRASADGQLSPPATQPTPSLHAPSSALIQQLLATPAVEIPGSSVPTATSAASKASAKSPVTVNSLQRDADAVASLGTAVPITPRVLVSGAELPPLPPKPNSTCPECPICPDMSQYIKLDEVPCWNCSLP